MSAFAEVLATLPDIGQVARLELRDANGRLHAVIDNRPGRKGSVAVYHHLALKHPELGPQAAREGLALYREHVADARARPGAHPNIDRLLRIIREGLSLTVRVIPHA